MVSTEPRGLEIDSSARVILRRRLLAAARAIPGVAAAARVNSRPFGTNTAALIVPGVDSVERLGRFNFQAADPDYFAGAAAPSQMFSWTEEKSVVSNAGCETINWRAVGTWPNKVSRSPATASSMAPGSNCSWNTSVPPGTRVSPVTSPMQPMWLIGRLSRARAGSMGQMAYWTRATALMVRGGQCLSRGTPI